jgi:hypothetical protein
MVQQFDRARIDEHIAAYRKVLSRYRDLLAADTGDDSKIGGFSTFFR